MLIRASWIASGIDASTLKGSYRPNEVSIFGGRKINSSCAPRIFMRLLQLADGVDDETWLVKVTLPGGD